MRHPALLVFGKQVRKIRLSRKLSQEKLAEMAEVHRNFIGVVERGESNCGLLTIIAIAKALHVKPAKLLSTL